VSEPYDGPDLPELPDVEETVLIESDCICEWETSCGGTGLVRCEGCGGDFCVCADCNGNGEMECPGCSDCPAEECWPEEE
jgi:hypothetical protein